MPVYTAFPESPAKDIPVPTIKSYSVLVCVVPIPTFKVVDNPVFPFTKIQP